MIIKKNDVDVCYKDVCVKAKGQSADIITAAVAFALICVGLSFIAKAVK